MPASSRQVGFRELLLFLAYDGERAHRIELAENLAPWIQRTHDSVSPPPSASSPLSHSPPSTPDASPNGAAHDLGAAAAPKREEEDSLAVKMEVCGHCLCHASPAYAAPGGQRELSFSFMRGHVEALRRHPLSGKGPIQLVLVG